MRRLAAVWLSIALMISEAHGNTIKVWELTPKNNATGFTAGVFDELEPVWQDSHLKRVLLKLLVSPTKTRAWFSQSESMTTWTVALPSNELFTFRSIEMRDGHFFWDYAQQTWVRIASHEGATGAIFVLSAGLANRSSIGTLSFLPIRCSAPDLEIRQDGKTLASDRLVYHRGFIADIRSFHFEGLTGLSIERVLDVGGWVYREPAIQQPRKAAILHSPPASAELELERLKKLLWSSTQLHRNFLF